MPQSAPRKTRRFRRVYNIEVMLRTVSKHGGEIGVCGTCMDTRGVTEPELAEAAHRSTLDQFTEWTQWAEKTCVF